LKRQIHSNLNAGANLDGFALGNREAGLFNDDPVVADRKVGRGIQTLFVCRQIEGAVRVNADDLDLGARNDSTGLVSHHTLNRAAINLGT
jgi:hypothetical protein